MSLRISHISFDIPYDDVDQCVKYRGIFPRAKFGIVLDGLSKPSSSQLKSFWKVCNTTTKEGVGIVFKITLKDLAAQEFLNSGTCKDLEWIRKVQKHRSAYDAIQINLPDVQDLQIDLNSFLKGVYDLQIPVVFRMLPYMAHATLFDTAKSKNLWAIPLLLPRVMGTGAMIQIPPALAGLPTGYEFSLDTISAEDWKTFLGKLDENVFAKCENFVWFNLTYSGPFPFHEYFSLFYPSLEPFWYKFQEEENVG